MPTKPPRTIGPHVHRNIRVVWRIIHTWGPGFGDEREYSIIRQGDTVTISGLKNDTTLPQDVARQLGQALIDAADWADGEATA